MKKLLIILIALLSLSYAVQSQTITDTATLRTYINSNIVPNASGSITAAKMNNVLNGIASLMKAYAVDSAWWLAPDTLVLGRRGGFASYKVRIAISPAGAETDPTVSAAAKAITSGDVTNWNSKQAALSGSSTVSIVANVISASNTTALWNANQLQGRSVSSTAPTTSQVLSWDGSAWSPATVTGAADGNNYTTGNTFNTGTGILTQTRSGLASLTVDLDGRYFDAITKVDSITTFFKDGSAVFRDTLFTTQLARPLYAIDEYTIGVKNDSAAWNADKLQGRNLASTAPTDGQAIVWDNAGSTWKPGTVSGGGGTPAGSATELQYRNAGAFGAMSGTSWDETNRKLTLSKTTGDSASLVFDGNYIGSKTFMKLRPPVKNDSVPEWHFISQVNANDDLTYTNHVLKIRPWAKDKNKYYGIGDEWEGRWKTGGATYFERHIEFHHHYNSENARLLSFTTISRDSMANSQSQLDIRGNVFQLLDLKNNPYFYIGKSGNYTGVNALTELIGLNPYHRLTDETAPTVNYSTIQQSGIDLNIQSARNISFSSRQTFKNLYFLGMQLYGDAGFLTSSANWGSNGLLVVNPTHASTGVARFQHTGTDALWILNNRRILVNSSTDNTIGQLQINGKVTIATVDSTAVPANGSYLFADPTTGEIKRAVPPGGGSGVTGSLTSGRVPKATGTSSIGDGLIRDNGSGVGIGGASVANNMLDVQGGNSRFDLYDAGAKYGELAVETPAGTSNLHVRLRRTSSSGLAKWFFAVDASNVDRYWLSLDNGSGEMSHEFAAGGWYPNWKFGGTEKMRLNSNGELQIGSTTDQGVFTLQNTGGFYQNGAFSLRGTVASASPTSILFKQSDSTISQLPFTGSTANFLRADGTFAAPSTGLPSQTGNADKFLKTDGTTASWAHPIFPWDYAIRDSASTSNAVATTAHTITLDANSRGIVEVRVEAVSSDGTKGLTGIKRVRYKKIAGTLTLGTVETEMAIERDGGLTTADFTITTSSNNVIIQVTGESAQALDWKVTILTTNKTIFP